MYSRDEITEPFWAENSTGRSGRDPLAIQNSSVVIYANMIVGITNVTNRIRYMGFYCWLFEAIAHKVTKPNSLVEQQLYLRRAELLLAYIMVKNFPKETGVSGTDYAFKNIEPIIILGKGADIENKKSGKVYWQYSLGIFGQYYSGAVSALDLIFHPQDEVNTYTLTPKGQKLGKAFAANVHAATLEFFLKSIFDGTIAEDKLVELTPFALHIIPPNSSEQKLYREILLSEDVKNIHPTYNRRNTIQMLLKLLNENPDGIENLPSAFLRNNFENQTKNQVLENDTSTAWYLFEINELLHVAFEHFHAAFQYSIAKYPTSMNETLQNLQDKAAEAFEKESMNPYRLTLNELSEQVEVEKVYDYFTAMEKSYKKNWGLCLSNAILTIIAVYKQSKVHKKQLFDFACLPENNYIRPGNAIELIAELVEPKSLLSLREYTRVILLHAINLHTYSSYQKSRIGQGLVHNYMIESNMAWRLRETSPSRTTPRLQNATQYLLDTGLLTKDGKFIKITDDGLKLIEGL
jgi:hypothetical protein